MRGFPLQEREADEAWLDGLEASRRPVAQCSGCGLLTADRRAVTCCGGQCLDPSGRSCNAWPCPGCGRLHYWTCSFKMPDDSDIPGMLMGGCR